MRQRDERNNFLDKIHRDSSRREKEIKRQREVDRDKVTERLIQTVGE